MTIDVIRQLFHLLLAEKGVQVSEETDDRELLRLLLDMGPLPAAAETALAAVFDAAAQTSKKTPL